MRRSTAPGKKADTPQIIYRLKAVVYSHVISQGLGYGWVRFWPRVSAKVKSVTKLFILDHIFTASYHYLVRHEESKANANPVPKSFL